MPTLRKLLTAIAIIFLICFIINVVLRYAVPTDQYKQLIESQVAAHTNYNLTIKGDVGLSLFPAPQLILNDVTLQDKTGNANVKAGQIDVQVQWAPLVSHQIVLNYLNVTDTLIHLSPNLAILFNGKIMVNMATQTASIPNFRATLNGVPLHGQANATWVTQSGITKVTFSSTTHMANGLITKSGECDINSNTKHLSVNESVKIMNVDLGPIFRAFNFKQRFGGILNASAQLTTNDNNGSWLSNLNGNGNFTISKASFGQLDLMSAVNQNLKVLNFATVTGTFNIRNGTFSNNDLLMTGPLLHATGAGSINLPNNTINYQLSLQEKLTDSFKLPVTISGNLGHPNVQINLKKTVNNVINTILNDHKLNLKKLFQ